MLAAIQAEKEVTPPDLTPLEACVPIALVVWPKVEPDMALFTI